MHEATGSDDVQYPSMTGNKTGLLDVIRWEIQKLKCTIFHGNSFRHTQRGLLLRNFQV